MSIQSNHFPETLPEPDRRARDEFEASAIHAAYAAARDLAGIGYCPEDVAAIVAHAFEAEPVPVELPVGAEPIPF